MSILLFYGSLFLSRCFFAKGCKNTNGHKFSTFFQLIFLLFISHYILSFFFSLSLFHLCYILPWEGNIYPFNTWNWVSFNPFVYFIYFLNPLFVYLYWLYFLSFLGYNHGRVLWFFLVGLRLQLSFYLA